MPHLPAERGNPGCPNFCMDDGFRAINGYIEQFPEIVEVMRGFLINYVYNFWFLQIGTKYISVFGQDHRTNNYLESFHSTLIKQMGRHPNIWDFLRKLHPQFLMWFKHL